jgi:hypothetical protein
MEVLLRILFTVRGLILAGTVTLAVAGSYLDQGPAAPAAGMNSHLGTQMRAGATTQILPHRFCTSVPVAPEMCW